MTPPATSKIQRGSPAFWRANIALFLSAFSVFALLYSVQPLLPLFVRDFGINAGTSSLALSATSIVLAVSMLFASGAADRWGRKNLMAVSLVSAAFLGLVTPFMPSWPGMIAVRGLQGLALSGVPAVAMVYLAEEMEPDALGFSMGLYIGGSGIGGMSGRLLVGLLTDLESWRFALAALGGVACVNAAAFWWLLPRPVHSPKRRTERVSLASMVFRQFRDPGLPWLFAAGFLLMGTFVTLYNYIGFRLSAPPYGLSHGTISFIFVVYLFGPFGSTWIGALAGRLGRRKVLWLLVIVMAVGLGLTSLSPITAIVAGLAVTTFAFFSAHSVISSWVARRAPEGKAQASSLYLFFYYIGASVIGTCGGYAWSLWGWPGVILLTSGSLLLAFLVSIRLFFLPPLPIQETPVKVAARF